MSSMENIKRILVESRINLRPLPPAPKGKEEYLREFKRQLMTRISKYWRGRGDAMLFMNGSIMNLHLYNHERIMYSIDLIFNFNLDKDDVKNFMLKTEVHPRYTEPIELTNTISEINRSIGNFNRIIQHIKEHYDEYKELYNKSKKQNRIKKQISEYKSRINLAVKKPHNVYAELLYRDGANYKTTFGVVVPEEIRDEINVGDELTIETFNIEPSDMWNYHGTPDTELDHNLVDVIGLYDDEESLGDIPLLNDNLW